MKDKGLGDTIERVTRATGIKFLSEVYAKKAKRSCGCNSRKERLNKAVPYGKQTI